MQHKHTLSDDDNGMACKQPHRTQVVGQPDDKGCVSDRAKPDLAGRLTQR